MLDDSGSMTGNPWKILEESVKNFFEKNFINSTVRKHSVISCIIHSHVSRIVFRNITGDNINTDLMKHIKFGGGENDFDAPLIHALEIMEENNATTNKFILCFMTDGIWTFPKTAISKIKLSSFMGKIVFKALYFGNAVAPQLMHDIAKEFPDGKVETAINVE